MGAEPKRKLVIMNLDEEETNDTVLTMCKSFGNVVHFNRPPLSKNYAFVTYEDVSSAQEALVALKKKKVNVKYARDESMSHNTLASTQSLDSNGNITKKTKIVRDEYASASASDDGHNDSMLESCGRCNGSAGLQCERCGDYYCSVVCQSADWTRHRLICFPMPRLIRAKSTCTIFGQSSRNVSATNSPPRKRVEMQDTSIGCAEVTVTKTDAEPNELCKPLAPTASEPKIAHQPVKDTQNVLSPPRKLHERAPVASTIADTIKESSTKAMNGLSPEPSIAIAKAESNASPAQFTEIKTEANTVSSPVAKSAASVARHDELKNGSKVRLVYASNHYSAYIRSSASDSEYSSILARVAETAAKAGKLTKLPQRNDMVSAPFLGDYYRAIVVKAESTEQPIRVAFLDFGNVDTVQFDDLRELDDDLKNAKRFTFRVFFDGVDRETPNPEGLALLKQVENEVKTSFTMHCGSNTPLIVKDSLVKLINTKTMECLNDKLTSTAATAKPPTEPTSILKSSPPVLPPTPPKKESQFAKLDLNCKRVMILDDGLFQYGKVACADVKYKKNVVSNEQIIQDCGVEALKKAPFKPKVGDKCLVRILESEELWWFRGQCLRVNDVKAQVMLLDSGKPTIVTLDKVREFDEKCDFPPRTSICKIKNIAVDQDGKTTPQTVDKLRSKLTIFEEFDIEEVEVTNDDEFSIKFSCI